MTIELSTIVAVMVPVVGGVVWLVRLEGRVNLSDQRHADIKDALNEIKSDLKRIRSFMGSGVER